MLAAAYLTVGYYDYKNRMIVEEILFYKGEDAVPIRRERALKWIVSSVLMSISLGLTATVTYLLVQMYYYFDPKVMKDEAGRIRTIYITFTLAYISRTLVNLLTRFNVIKEGLNPYIVNLVCYNIWDILPLTLIMVYHSKCFDAQQRQLEEEAAAAAAEAEAAENERSSSSSSSSTDSQSSN